MRGAASRPGPADDGWGPWVEPASQAYELVPPEQSSPGAQAGPDDLVDRPVVVPTDPLTDPAADPPPSGPIATGTGVPGPASPGRAAGPPISWPITSWAGAFVRGGTAPVGHPSTDHPSTHHPSTGAPFLDPTPTDPTPTDPTPTDPTPTDHLTALPTAHLRRRRRYRRQRGLVRRQADHWVERRWRREDRRRAAASGRQVDVSSVLTAAAAVLAVVGVGLIVWASAEQVHPPTPPPVSDPSPAEVVPVSGAPAVRTLPFFAGPGAAVPTVAGLPAGRLAWGDLLPTTGLLPHGPTPGARAAAGPSPDQIRAARELAAVPVSPPTTIRIPTIRVGAPVDDVGLTPDGEMEVPAPGPAYDHAAWYRYSVTPGRQGPSVIIGHIDSRANGPSVFFELGRLRPGDRVDVTRADGVAVGFAVTDVRTVSKEAFPTEAVYGPTPGAELRLISCGGSFDSSVRSYRDNIVVFAREIPPPPVRVAPPISVLPEPVPSLLPRLPTVVPAHPAR